MKVFTYISLALFLLVSCNNLKEISSETPEETKPKPSWTSDRPISNAYYVGIGSSSKVLEPINFASKAKNNAFNDLASEISVTIKGESFLNTLEVNRNFQEQFMSQVNATSDERVEGFEIVDSWQNDKEYWVYYRLSKAKHAEIKATKKNEVLTSAYDSYVRGKENVTKGMVHSAVNDFLTGLQTMEPYWNEANPYTEANGQEIFLDNALFSDLQKTIQGLNLEIPLNEIVLQASNKYEVEVGIKTTLNGVEMGGIPLLYDFDTGKYTRYKPLVSNQNGIVSAQIRGVNIDNKDNALMVKLDLDQLVRNFKNDAFMIEVIKNLPEKRVLVPIRVIMPNLYIESNESNLGEPLSTSFLANALKSKMVNKGFNLTTNFEEADYLVQISSSTSQGGTSQGFHVCFLQFEVVVLDNNSAEIIFQDSRSSIKGLQLNFPAAGMEAYKKGGKLIEKDITDDLVDKIL